MVMIEVNEGLCGSAESTWLIKRYGYFWPRAVIKFVKEHILYRFGVPESIVSDQAQYFIGGELAAFAKEMGITMTHASPYFAQGNGQAESTNTKDTCMRTSWPPAHHL